MQPAISVVTPSFNQGEFLERTIRSVLDQQIPDLEYVVMDGGSTDQSVAVLRRFESRLHWVSEKDRGQAHAVNKGLAATRGDIIGWLNSDDIYYPGAVRAVLDVFQQCPDVDLVYGNAHHIDVNDQILEVYPTEPWNPQRLTERCYLCQPAVFFRRRTVEQHGLLNEKLQYCMDYEFWLRLAQADVRAVHLPVFLAGSRLYATNKTLGARVAVHREFVAMLSERLGQVPGRWLWNYAFAVTRADRAPKLLLPFWLPALIWTAVAASSRWNRSVSPRLAADLAGKITDRLVTRQPLDRSATHVG
ncbi:MAG: glycosyltransferase [Planctomycetia bacterium]|nr:glycosyltransferase [Planctomycetia bacterium]